MRITVQNDILKQTAVLLLCGLLSCNVFAQQRNKNDATKIANDFIEGNLPKYVDSEMKLRLSSSNISSSEALKTGKEAYYIFAPPSEEKGFVIVSGDERMPAILAYSDEGQFDIDNIPPSVRYWLDCYAEAFLALDSRSDTVPLRASSVNPGGISPLLENNSWGQDDPYNRLCPAVRNERCVTGCVATAMAQVMRFHQYPAVGKGRISYTTETNNIHIQRNLASSQFRWDDMIDDYSGTYTPEQADAVAELMYSCGVSVNMDYCTSSQGGSGAYQSSLIKAFIENFGYDQDAAFMTRSYCSEEDWHNILVRELNEGRPVNYAGTSMRDGGHSFVFDGYRVSEGNKYPDYHVNWGWNGSCNGYYQIADLSPSENGLHATAGGFNNSQQITIGIKPEDGNSDGSIYLCTTKLHTSAATAKAGSTINVYAASCSNMSYKEFNGTIHATLISMDDGKETILGESRLKALSFLREQNNVNIEITLPNNLADGQYIVQLRSRQTGENEYQQVFSKQYPQLTVSATGEDTSEVISKAVLGSSELEVVADSANICLNIYELQNLQPSPFIGDLRMILADSTGKQLVSFGDSVQPGELSTFEIMGDPLKIQGSLTGNWPNGNYRLYVGAKLINSPTYALVSYYDISQPSIEYQELYLDAQINDGKITIEGHTYEIRPTTAIESASSSKIRENPYVISLSGIRYDRDKHSIPPGIYISGRKKILIR